MATARNDKPTVHASLASLDVEAAAEPFRFAVKNNKIITFPSPREMPWDQAETFMQSMESATSTTAVLEAWLSEEDYSALKASKLTLGQVEALMTKVGEHYEGILGDAPKDSDSSTT